MRMFLKHAYAEPLFLNLYTYILTYIKPNRLTVMYVGVYLNV